MLSVVEAAAYLQGADNILILTHVRPDGDTVGSAAGLCAALRAIGKTAYLLSNPELTRSITPYFMPYVAPEDFQPDFVVSADIATLELLPENAKAYGKRIDLAIDHHPSFEHFGKEHVLRPKAAACAEIVYDIARQLTPLTPAIALPLYLGISTDTGCFVYSNTSPRTHEIAGKLMAVGIDHQTINKVFFQTKSRKRMQLEGAMLETMTFHDAGRCVILAVPMSLMARFCADESDAEDLSALGPMIEGTDCAITMREQETGKWKLSVRTGKRINASTLCKTFGGGGHAAAAGCTISGSFEEVKAKVLNILTQTVENFQQ